MSGDDFSQYRRALPADATVAHWTGPDGWRFRRFDWRSPEPRGALLFVGGRGDAFEKYLETLAHWQTRGWSITSLDWRGQGGSGRSLAGSDIGHVESFDHYLGDLAAFWGEWAGQATGPTVAIGHSMGGHLVLRAAVEARIDPAAAVLVAPMLGLRTPLGPRWGGALARWIGGRGDPARAAWRGNERPGSLTSRQRLLTHDQSRYDDERWWRDRVPELRLGPPSWTWLVEAFASTAALATDPRLATFDLPVLMLVADADRLVDPRAATRIAARLPGAELHRFGPEAAHELLREVDPVRTHALVLIDAFLDRVAAR